MRDILSKLDALINETALNPNDMKGDYDAKKKALQDIQVDPSTSKDPELKAELARRKADLEKEARDKGVIESTFEIGDAFDISFTEDSVIESTIVDILEDGIVIELDDAALEMLTNEGLTFLEGEVVTEEKQKGLDGKACWKGYKRIGTKMKGGKRVDNCVKEDHGPEDPDAEYNQGEYDREGDMAKDQLRTIDSAAEELYAIISANENLPEWVQKKITLAMDYIDTARDYLKSNKYAEDTDVEEASFPFAGAKVGHKEGPAGQWRNKGSKANKPAKAGDLVGGESIENEAKYQGREVPLGKPMAGDVKKSKVYVKNPQGRVVKVNFGDKKMKIKKSNPARRKSFRARHNCANPGPRHKARYWSCRAW
jgi:hypothetical protein